MRYKTPLREKVIGILICVIVFAIAVMYGWILTTDNVCDTPMGARDFRCVGHFSN